MAWCDAMEQPRILIAPSLQTLNERKDETPAANAEGNILSLRHPKSDTSTSYVYKDGFLQELHWFKQSYGSWFLGDYVCAEAESKPQVYYHGHCGYGSLYITTSVDPIFIFLPIFADARLKKGSNLGVFRQLDEILHVEGYPGYQHLMPMAENSMKLVCEVKEVGSSKFFRLNDSRVLSWLCCKVLNLKASLEKLDKNYAIQDEKETLKEIIAILGEYLNDEPWLTKLCSHLRLNIQEALQKTPKIGPDEGFQENTQVSSSGKVATEKSKSSSGKQPKKLKTETNSRNIKDMFRSANKRRS